jgi:hypothetical protein
MAVPPNLRKVAAVIVVLLVVIALLAIDTDLSVLLAVLITVGGLAWLTFRVFAAVANVLFGHHVVARILAFGFAVAIFPAMVIAPFQAAAGLLRYLSQVAPALATSWPQLQNGDPEALGVLSKLVDGAIAAAQMPLIQIIFGVVTWVAVGHLLSFIFLQPTSIITAVGKVAGPLGLFSDYLRSTVAVMSSSLFANVRMPSSGLWTHVAIVTTLAVGIYLILGAIATIPYLSQESTPVDEMATRLANALDSLQRTEDQFNSRHPLTLPSVDPLAELKEFANVSKLPDSVANERDVAKIKGPVGETTAGSRNPDLSPAFEKESRDEVVRQIAQLEKVRSASQSQWTRMRQDARDAEAKLRPSLEAQFRSEITLLRGTREQIRYLEAVRDSYSAELGNIDRNLDFCRKAIQRVDDFARDVGNRTMARVTRARSVLRNFSEADLKAPPIDSLIDTFTETSLDADAPTVELFCKPYAVVFAPELPRRGEGWGPLAKIFDWLLATDSLDVVVIIGMLGAGLFGSAVGTFFTVRSKGAGASAEGLMGHLIRSFAATMVVYLGLKTGIAFAAVGNPNPDPYLMLFLCFIGTVYSDDVWGWAKRAGRGYWNHSNRHEKPAKKAPSSESSAQQ